MSTASADDKTRPSNRPVQQLNSGERVQGTEAKTSATLRRNAPPDGHTELAFAQQYLRESANREHRAAAVNLLWAAIGKGSTEAEVTLANLYLGSNSVPGKNCEQARILLRAASKSGDLVARQKIAALRDYGCR
jgi:hypothetical protein